MNRRSFCRSALAAASLPLISPGIARASSPLALTSVSRTIEVNGRSAKVFGLMGPDGKPGLSLAAGQTYDVDLANRLGEDTMIHWHGLLPEWQYDGVPGLPLPLLKEGETRRYKLPSGQPGTHWMHAHTLQEQNLLAAPLIVRGPQEAGSAVQEITVLLHDFSFTPAAELLERLGSGGMMNHQGMVGHGMMGGGMMGMDVNDIEYDAYLANDRTLDDPEVHSVEKGGTVRLRIINGATATAFTIDTGALAGTVVAVDGQDIVPIAARQFPLGMGQRIDFRLEIPAEGGSFPVLARREGGPQRTGIILATAGAAIARLSPEGSEASPLLTLETEAMLMAAMPLAEKPAARRHAVILTGSMMGYQWGIESRDPLSVKTGERVEIEMRNYSMMTHPMHLHGHHFQVVAINGRRFRGAVRDTVNVPHMNSVTFAFDAANPGKTWAFHCHHLYHMAAGMMSAVEYEGA